MIARASQLFLPTLRDAPADAEAASHQLLVRGGFIRQIGAGLWALVTIITGFQILEFGGALNAGPYFHLAGSSVP